MRTRTLGHHSSSNHETDFDALQGFVAADGRLGDREGNLGFAVHPFCLTWIATE